jgi:hypothetical protein
MTVILLPSPELQFSDANGRPYAAGTVETYIPATTTPKASWNDPAGGGGHLNTNPIVLDSAGRCILYGDGNYRLVLRDVAGNLIWDQVSSTVVSAAMQPVVGAPTIPDAVTLLGIQALIDASVAIETARAEAAEATLQTHINTQATNLANAETTINAAIAAETAARIAADNTLAALIAGLPIVPTAAKYYAGLGSTNGIGNFIVTFPTAFATRLISFEVFEAGALPPDWPAPSNPGGSGTERFWCTLTVADTAHVEGGLLAGIFSDAGASVTQTLKSFYWIALGY